MSCSGSCPRPTYTQTQHPSRLTARLTANPPDNRHPRRTTLDAYTHSDLRRCGRQCPPDQLTRTESRGGELCSAWALNSLYGPDLRRCSAVTGGYIRGSGANQAGAVISGAAAVVLRQHPTRINNQVKALLT